MATSDREPNPYAPPHSAGPEVVRTSRHKRLGWLALFVLFLPLFLAYPLYYWTMNHAGGWLVSHRVEHREIHLHMAYNAILATMICFTTYLALYLLHLSRWRRRFTFWLLLLAAPLMLPAGLSALLLVSSYVAFR